MTPSGRHTAFSFFISLLSLLLSVYTVLFAGSVEWFGTNFSVLAVTGANHYRGFFIWGLLAACYYLLVLGGISRTLSSPHAQLLICALCLMGCGALGASLAIPYLPENFPRYADLHVVLAFSACVFLMAALLTAILSCGGTYRRLLGVWWGIIGISTLLFVWVGIVSTALEVFFTLSTVWLTRRLYLHRRST